MWATIRLKVGAVVFEAKPDGGAIARAILARLPIESVAQRWGEEIYFDVPVKMGNTAPTLDVKVGDVAYWPDGPCLCIFFGKTPASKGNEPRPASEVTVIGRTDAGPVLLRSVKDGATITLS